MTQSNQDLLRTIFRNSFWSIFAAIAGPILSFLFGGLTIRYVGIEAAGFSLAVGAILGIAGRFGTLGIGDAIIPAMAAAIGAGDRQRVRRLVGTLLVATVVYGCLVAATLVTFADPIVAWTRTSVPRDVAVTFVLMVAATTVVNALAGSMMVLLSAASRHDLVTKTTLPLSLLSGIVGCTLVPLFPSLLTVALIGLCSSLVNLPVFFTLARRVTPETVRPAFSLTELPALVRYGFWISLTRILSAMTGGVDDLMLTAACGSAAVPPWAICKRLYLTLHTFLAQHVEHLIPTLGSVRERSRQAFESINEGMHWYVAVVAAAGYTLVAWAGPAIIAAAAGGRVAALCTTPLFAYSVIGIFYSLNVIPVISAMALSDARPGFFIALTSNCSQLAAVFLLARNLGVPAAYLAPLFAIPFLVIALGTSSSRLLDPGLAGRRIRPVLVPSALGLAGVLSSLAAPAAWTLIERAGAGVAIAAAVLALTIAVERRLGINAEPHRHVLRVIHHALDLVAACTRSLRAPAASRGAEKPLPPGRGEAV